MTTQARDWKIEELVQRIRRETGRQVPNVDPDGPGVHGRVLMLLRDPGDAGALVTGYLSPSKNRDRTAANQRRLMLEAGLAEDICVFWNAFPWDLRGERPSAADKRRGASYLTQLVARLPRLCAIVACGADAHEVCRLASLPFYKVSHPSDRGLGGGVKGARREREDTFRKQLSTVARLAAQ